MFEVKKPITTCGIGYDQLPIDILNSKVLTKNELEDILEEYIKLFILCKTCGNPEFSKTKTKKEEIRTCKACGTSRIC